MTSRLRAKSIIHYLGPTSAVAALAALIALPTWARAESVVTYYHEDPTGSPIAATDEVGVPLWHERYQPFGERTVNDPAAADHSQWFTGHQHDETTGLTYTKARYYDPTTGRFLSMDPAEAK